VGLALKCLNNEKTSELRFIETPGQTQKKAYNMLSIGGAVCGDTCVMRKPVMRVQSILR